MPTPRTQIQTYYTPATFKRAIERKLGDDKVRVELNPESYWGEGYIPTDPNPVLGADGILAQAIIWYSRVWPKTGLKPIPSNGTGVYKLTPDDYGMGVLDVLFPRDTSIAALFSMGGYTDPFVLWSGSYLREIADVELALQYYEVSGRYFGNDRVWSFDIDYDKEPIEGLLYISPKRVFSKPIMFRFAKPWAVEEIPMVDMDIIVEYGAALVKEAVGHIRRKYTSVPGENEGQTLDGSDLVSEATEAKEKLTEKLKLRKGDWLPASLY